MIIPLFFYSIIFIGFLCALRYYRYAKNHDNHFFISIIYFIIVFIILLNIYTTSGYAESSPDVVYYGGGWNTTAVTTVGSASIIQQFPQNVTYLRFSVYPAIYLNDVNNTNSYKSIGMTFIANIKYNEGTAVMTTNNTVVWSSGNWYVRGIWIQNVSGISLPISTNIQFVASNSNYMDSWPITSGDVGYDSGAPGSKWKLELWYIDPTGAAIPPSPINLAQTNDSASYVNWTWEAGTGNITNSFNVSVNNSWTNGSANLFYNHTELTYLSWSNISVFAFNSSGAGTLNETAVTDSVQLPAPSEYIPPDPANLANTTGNFWVNYTWNAGSGNVTDSFNVSQNNTWTNGSANTYFNTTVGGSGWSNITIWAFNNSGIGTLSSGNISQNTQAPPSEVTISCSVGWCYAASNYSSKTLLELDNLFSTDTIQGHYNATSQKYESHRTDYAFNQNVSVAQKEGHYYYFSTATDIITTPGSTPSITLKTGWNLVGNYGSSARTLSALKTSIGGAATSAKYYDKTLKTWVSTDSQSVPAMESFFVYMTEQTDWSD